MPTFNVDRFSVDKADFLNSFFDKHHQKLNE